MKHEKERIGKNDKPKRVATITRLFAVVNSSGSSPILSVLLSLNRGNSVKNIQH